MEDQLINLISAGAGVIIALAFEWFPGLSTWFNGLTKMTKKIVVAAVMFVIAAAIVGASCAGLLARFFPDIALTCDVPGIWIVVMAWISAVGAAQTVHTFVNKAIHAVRGK